MIFMKNQDLQQSLLENNARALNTTKIDIAKSTHIINGLVVVLKSINVTVYNSNLSIKTRSGQQTVLICVWKWGVTFQAKKGFSVQIRMYHAILSKKCLGNCPVTLHTIQWCGV